ncbi:MAG: hypothetical protein KTR20_10565 [Cellvibrionaceae bacterium]|nr:hypothetical protein [Cellvibrionaceae bacterium]
MIWLTRTLITLLMAGIIALIFYYNKDQPRIFIVHSYNTDLAWVKEIDKGLNIQLDKQLARAHVRRHYMNLKNHPNCNYYRVAAKDTRLAIKSWQPDIVILVDDLAQQLIGVNYLQMIENPSKPIAVWHGEIAQNLAKSTCPEKQQEAEIFFEFGQDIVIEDKLPLLIFAGVNHDVDSYGYYDADNISGIFERKNFRALTETLLALSQGSASKKTNKVMVLNEYSNTVFREMARYRNPINWPDSLHLVDVVMAATESQWKAAVQQANAANAMLLIANYQAVYRDNKKQKIPAAELVQWTEQHADYPVLGAGTSYVADGGAITLAISGREQGEKAIVLAADYLKNGTVPETEDAKLFLVGLNTRLLKIKDITLPKIYEAFSETVKPFLPLSEVVHFTPEGELK